MHFLHLTFLYCILSFFCNDPALESALNSSTQISKSITNPAPTNAVVPGTTNLMLQSTDGGQTWTDISQTLPEIEQPDDFFAGTSDLYLRVQNEMYRSKSNLKTPVWEKENILDPRCTSIAFNRAGVIAYNYEGQIFQHSSSAGTWSPVYQNLKRQTLQTIFETSDGTVFASCESGLYKSTDGGQSWKQVFHGGGGMAMAASQGVLIATGQKGIMRSTDNGEHWEWIISEGGVGIAVESIDGGFAAIVYNTKTMSRRIFISLDKGENWKTIDEGLYPSMTISSIKQMGKYLICGHPDGIFRSSDMGKTWSMVHPNFDKSKIYFRTVNNPLRDDRKVFKIYVSGSTLYAVARNPGC